jgi:hypothetical protein
MTPKREITRADLMPLDAYARLRDERRRAVMAEKKRRRLEVGPVAIFLFENFASMWLQVQEMLRIEKGGEAQIDDELAAYNPLVPKGSELVATVMFEIDDPVRRKALLSRLGGVEETAVIVVAGETVKGVPEADVDRTTAAGKASSVKFIHFPFTRAQTGSRARRRDHGRLQHPARAHGGSCRKQPAPPGRRLRLENPLPLWERGLGRGRAPSFGARLLDRLVGIGAPELVAPQPAFVPGGLDPAPGGAHSSSRPMTPGASRATAGASAAGSRRNIRSAPTTSAVRRPSSMLWCTQPTVPCQSRTLRQVSNSPITSTGIDRRT